jgi:hypothetical protein
MDGVIFERCEPDLEPFVRTSRANTETPHADPSRDMASLDSRKSFHPDLGADSVSAAGCLEAGIRITRASARLGGPSGRDCDDEQEDENRPRTEGGWEHRASR